MKLLITGGLGHIGSFVINRLTKIKKLKKIYIIDNFCGGNYHILKKIKHPKIVFIFLDLKYQKQLLKLPKVNIVLHLASITNAEKSYEEKKEIFRNNLSSFKNIIHYCKIYNSKLIHISSTSVYGPQKKNVDETEKELFPTSPYSIIKLKEENLLKKQKKFKFITLRFGTISGYSEGMRFHTAVNKFCLNAVMKIPIPIWDNGKVLKLKRPYLSLNDALRVFKFIINNNFFPNEIFNIFSENKSISQILNILKKNKLKPIIEPVRSKISNSQSYIINRKKIKNLKLSSKISDDIKKIITYLK